MNALLHEAEFSFMLEWCILLTYGIKIAQTFANTKHMNRIVK
jgi:hypothetical protein